MEEISENYDDCILYELLVYAEWKQEPEPSKCSKSGDGQPFKDFLLYLRKKNSLHPDVSRLLLSQLQWQFAVGGSGKVVAILQDTLLEIRSSRDEYSSVIGKAVVAKDANPQWRKMAWSSDCSLLAVANSSGIVYVYDLFGSSLFNIPCPKLQSEMVCVDAGNAVASILFIDSRVKSPKWSNELLIVDYEGKLSCYLVSHNEGFEENHTFTFSSHYRGSTGVTAVSHHPSHNMLFVAGPTNVPKVESIKTLGSTYGLFAWRLLNDFPHYRFALANDEKQAVLNAQRSWWNWVPTVGRKPKESIIFKMQVSPNGTLLACLHSCGAISLWHLPAIRLYRFWKLTEQLDYNVRNTQLSGKRRYRADDEFHPVDVNWWSDKALIIARNCGAVSVCSVHTLHNMLGESPEFLAAHPQISPMCSDRGFIGLECEIVVISKKKHLEDMTDMSDLDGTVEYQDEEIDDEDDEDDFDGNSSILERSLTSVQSAVYLMTDIEKFQPQKKKPKLVNKTYRLLGLKSTTPEELYARKIDNEEYGEALALAKAYSLDCDLVYQRQWRNSNVSVATIYDYLSKITKRSWVLKECVERIPETFAAARELLEFGLRGTNLETLLAIGEGTDGGHFVAHNLEVGGGDDSDMVDEETEKLRFAEMNQDLLNKIISQKLTDQQKDLLRYRQQLLQYLDRLCTYQLILGGPHLADEDYDRSFYAHYRSVSALSSAVDYARDSNSHAVEIMFTYHGEDTLAHWLPVLANFPETMNPMDYKSLLPECNGDGDVFLWEQKNLRESDWCESTEFRGIYVPDTPSPLYDDDSSLKQFSAELNGLTAGILTAWYAYRVQQIESRSCMVDHALTMVKLARERNISGLNVLTFHLLTLETLVYEVFLEHVRLEALQKLTDLEVAKLLMSKTTEVTFVSDVKHLLLPFLTRCEKRTEGAMRSLLRGYVLEVSSDSLALPLKLFEHLRDNRTSPLFTSEEDTMVLVIDCLYAYKQADQLEKAFAIVECVPERGFGSQNPVISRLHDQLDDLESDLRAASIFERNAIQKPLYFIRDSKKDALVVKPLLIKLARSIAKKMPPPSELQWNQLLNDLLDLQLKVFTCVDLEEIFEIYVATLLASGNKANIRATADILQRSKDERTSKKISYDRSVALVLDAASEYFDSSGSLTDPNMELSKACLHLITDKNSIIEEKLDLIASLQILNDFGVSMLPLQVRLCTERMRLVESCVRNKPSAYRNSQRLLQLADRLRVSGNDARQREGRVLVLIAETALQAKDYAYCADKCQELVAKSHAIGWEVVQQLGQCQEYGNLQVRNNLLAFALLYCTPDNIEVLINTRCLIQAQLLHEKIALQVRKHELAANSVDEDEFSDALTSPVAPEKEFLPISSLVGAVGDSTEMIRQTTFSLLKNVGNKHFWKNTFGWPRGEESEETSPDTDEPFERQGFPAFYESVCSECHLSRLDTRYDRYSMPDEGGPTLQMCRAMCRMALLEGTVALENCADNSEVLLQLSELTLPEDSCLGLSQLLSLHDPALSDSCFRNMHYTEISLQLATYYYALQVHKDTQTCDRELYLRPPSELIRVASATSSDSPSLVLYHKYSNLLADYLQGQRLNGLGCGIDVQRFTHDAEYRHDTIIGLAMTTDADRFDLSVRLGLRHDVSLGLIAASHAASLLMSGDQLSLSEMTARLADDNLVYLLRTEPQLVAHRLEQSVYPTIEGTDREHLLVYFSLLNSVSEDCIVNSLPPKEHVKLLKKLKAAVLDIDYKKLIEDPQNILAVFEPILSQDNIGNAGKFLKSLPEDLHCAVQIGNLYGMWARKEFLEIQTSTNSYPIAPGVCLQQLKKCCVYWNKMTAKDLLSFIKDICFTETSLDIMTVPCRKRILELTQNLCEKRRELADASLEGEWKDLSITFEQWREHLTAIEAICLDDACKLEMRQILRQLDLSRGENGPIRLLLQSAIQSSVSLRCLELLLEVIPKPSSTLQSLLETLLNSSLSDLNCEGTTSLPSIFRRIQEYVDAQVKIDDGEDCFAKRVCEKLEPLCGDLSVVPAVRLAALQLVQYLKPPSDKDSESVLFNHTQAMVATAWPSIAVSESDVLSEEARIDLFKSLAKETSEWMQIDTLHSILQKWPSSPVVNSVDEPWAQYLNTLLHFEEAKLDDVVPLLKSVLSKVNFSEKCLRDLVIGTDYLCDQTVPLLIYLLSDYQQLHLAAANIICKQQRYGSNPPSDLVLSLILKRRLAPHVVSSTVYPHLVDYMLQSESVEGTLGDVAGQIAEAGSVAEGGTLQMLHMGAPTALRVFATAVALAKHKAGGI